MIIIKKVCFRAEKEFDITVLTLFFIITEKREPLVISHYSIKLSTSYGKRNYKYVRKNSKKTEHFLTV